VPLAVLGPITQGHEDDGPDLAGPTAVPPRLPPRQPAPPGRLLPRWPLVRRLGCGPVRPGL